MRLGKKVSWAGIGVLIGVLAVLVSACGTPSTSGNKLPFSQQVLKYSIVPVSPDIASLDPALITDVYSFHMQQMIFPSLVTWDAKGNTIPWAATTVPSTANGGITNNGLTYTFHLHSGMQWSDGTPITASVFAYSINRGADPCVNNGTPAPGASFLYPIAGAVAFNTSPCSAAANSFNPTDNQTLVGKSIVAVDPLTLQITLAKSYSYFLGALTTSLGMAVPQQIITKYGLKAWGDHLAGFGGNMFLLSSWDHKGHINFVQNPNFWNGKTQLKEVDVNIYQSGETEYADYLDKRIQIGGPPASEYPAAKNRSDLHVLPYQAIGYIQPNWAKAPFNNVLARQAFALALNKQILASDINKGTVIATNHIIPVGDPAYNSALKGVDGTQSLTGNQALALQKITQYAAAACGGKIASCPPVTYVDTNDPTSHLNNLADLAQWKAALGGYPISLREVSFNDLINLVYGPAAGRPQLWGIGYAVDYNFAQDWTSLQFLPTSGTNVGNVDDTQANALMNQADTTPDQTQANALYDQAEQVLVNDVGWIPTWQQQQLLTVAPAVQNYTVTPNGFETYSTWLNMYLS